MFPAGLHVFILRSIFCTIFLFIFHCQVNQPVIQDTSAHTQTTMIPATQKQHSEVSETDGVLNEGRPVEMQHAQQCTRTADSKRRASSGSSRRKRYETDRV